MSNLIKRLKLAKLLSMFAEITTNEGVVFDYEGDLEIGTEVFTPDENGELVPVSDGEYVFDEKKYIVKSGKIETITVEEVIEEEKPAVEEEPANEPAPEEEEKPANEEEEEAPKEEEEPKTEEEEEKPAEEEEVKEDDEKDAKIAELEAKLAEAEAKIAELEEKIAKAEEPVDEPADEKFKKQEKVEKENYNLVAKLREIREK
jgi:hypothetical protein